MDTAFEIGARARARARTRTRKTSSENTLEDVRNGDQAVSASLQLLAQIPKKALHCSMYITSSGNQGLDVLSGINETHFSELSKLRCIELLWWH
jgi:hypothetical protein